MKKTINSFILLFLIRFPSLAFSQNCHTDSLNLNNVAVDFKGNYSYILPHHKYMSFLSESHFLFYEISCSKKTNGEKYWHQLYNYPTCGATFQYNNFGGSKILGKAYALYPFIQLPIIKQSNFQLAFKFGSGLAFLTKKFDKDINYKNIVISTNINICINLGFEFEQRINNSFSVNEGIHLQHFSNGALKMPNPGINLPSVSMGIRFNPAKSSIEKKYNQNIPEVDKKYFLSLMTAAGLKEIYYAYNIKYPAFSLSLGFNFQPSLKRIINLNVDAFYSFANYELVNRINNGTNMISLLRFGMSAGHEFLFGKTNFTFYMGRYLYAKDNSDGNIYNRVGFKRKINKNLFINLSLKSHHFVADYIEWGLGYNF